MFAPSGLDEGLIGLLRTAEIVGLVVFAMLIGGCASENESSSGNESSTGNDCYICGPTPYSAWDSRSFRDVQFAAEGLVSRYEECQEYVEHTGDFIGFQSCVKTEYSDFEFHVSGMVFEATGLHRLKADPCRATLRRYIDALNNLRGLARATRNTVVRRDLDHMPPSFKALPAASADLSRARSRVSCKSAIP